MSRNGSGTMSILNSFSPNTEIESAKFNANFSDIASEITNSLPRDGQAGMTGQMKAANGSSSAPSLTFGSDPDTGLYRKSANTMGIVAGGTEVGTVDPEGLKDTFGVVLSGIPTGAMMMYGATTAPAGWVRCNGLTIGNASSSATERDNADTSSLFSFLWTNYSDSVCEVSGGRGASAAADYAANKTIALPDLRGRALFGLDDMGGSASGRLANAVGFAETTNGASGGADTVTLARANLPNDTVNPTVSITDPGHAHGIKFDSDTREGGGSVSFVRSVGFGSTGGSTTSTNTATTGITATSSFALNGGTTQTAVSNMPPAFLTTFIIKL